MVVGNIFTGSLDDSAYRSLSRAETGSCGISVSDICFYTHHQYVSPIPRYPAGLLEAEPQWVEQRIGLEDYASTRMR